jgi:hypothetical protein
LEWQHTTGETKRELLVDDGSPHIRYQLGSRLVDRYL